GARAVLGRPDRRRHGALLRRRARRAERRARTGPGGRVNGAARSFRLPGDAAVAGGTVVLAGVGAVVAAVGALARDLPMVVAGGAAVTAALLVILTARWVDGLALLVLTLPLPALASGESARLPPVAVV